MSKISILLGIASLSTSLGAATHPDLMGDWRFDENQGEVVYDLNP